jgi:glycine oxidase
MNHPLNTDLLIVGGGVIGLSIARACQKRGRSVTVLDLPHPGMAASPAAAGMLSPLAEASEEGPFLETGLASLASYPAWIEALEADGGGSVGFHRSGKLKVAHTSAGLQKLEALAVRMADRGLPFTWCAPETLHDRTGTHTVSHHAALFLAHDAYLNPRLLMHVLARAADRAGVERREGVAWQVQGLEPHLSEGMRVRLADGRSVTAEQVVLATGAWTGQIAGLPASLPPVRPVLGQALLLASPDVILRTTVETERVYLVPRDRGRVLIGATVEERGFEIRHTPEIRDQLWAQAAAVIPALAQARLEEHWSGLRPGTPDALPVIGPVPGVSGLFLATGHFRNGILLAPWTGEAVARQLMGGEGPEVPEAFLPGRMFP